VCVSGDSGFGTANPSAKLNVYGDFLLNYAGFNHNSIFNISDGEEINRLSVLEDGDVFFSPADNLTILLPDTITFLGVTEASTTDNQSSLTFEHNISSGNNKLLMVGISLRQAVSTAHVGYVSLNDSINLSRIGYTDATNARVEAWYLVNPPEGTFNITVMINNSLTDRIVVGAINYGNVNQFNTFGSVVSNTSSSTSADVTVSSTSNDLVVAFLSRQNSNNRPYPNETTTERYVLASTAGTDTATQRIWGNGIDKFSVGGDTYLSWNWSTTSRPWTVIGVAIHPTYSTRVSVDDNGLDLNGNLNVTGNVSMDNFDINGAGHMTNLTLHASDNASQLMCITVNSTGSILASVGGC
jgi:hypothetical protein